MITTRIMKLADGEELISFEVGERVSVAVDEEDPRAELLEHRREAAACDSTSSRSSTFAEGRR